MFNNFGKWISGAGLLLLLAAPAHAQQVFFGEDAGADDMTPLASTPNSDAARDAFIAALSGPSGTEDFESFADGQGAPLIVDFGVGTATLTGSGIIENIAPGSTNGDGRYPTSGRQYWDSDQNFTITLSEGVRAFGFYGIDMGDFAGQLQVTFEMEAGGTIDVPIDHTINGPTSSVLYFGYINPEPFVSVSFTNSDAGDVFGFDDFTLALEETPSRPGPSVAVPADNLMALLTLLMLIGLTGVIAIRRT